MTSTTYTPKQIRAIAGAPEVSLPGTIKSGQNLAAGSVVALETSSGKHVQWVKDGTGGTGLAVGVLMHSVNASSTGLDADAPGVPILIQGYIRKADAQAGFSDAYAAGFSGAELPGRNIYYFAPGQLPPAE